MSSETSIIDEIEKYVKSDRVYKMKIPEGKNCFQFDSINEVVDVLISYDKKTKKMEILSAFYENPIRFLKDTGFMNIPESIEILKTCNESLHERHPKSCFSCRFFKNGNPKIMIALCMNKNKFETIFEIIAESGMPNKILFVEDINLYDYYSEKSGVLYETNSAIAQEVGIHLSMRLYNGTTIIEAPSMVTG